MTEAPVMEILSDLMRDLDRLTGLVVTAMREQLPDYGEGMLASAELVGVVRRNCERLLQQVIAPPGPEVGAEQAAATGAVRARQGVALEQVLSAYRLGGQVLCEELARRHRATGAGTAEQLLDLALAVWRAVDREALSVVAGYRAEAERAVDVRAQRAHAFIEELLTDTGLEASTSQLAQELGFASGPYLLVVVHLDGKGTADASVPELDGLSADVRRLWVARGTGRVGLLAGPSRALGQAVPSAVQRRAHQVVVLSDVLDDLGQIRLAHQVCELVAARPHPGTAMRSAEHLPEALLQACPPVAAQLRRMTLERLQSLTAQERASSLQTLRALLEHRWSPGGAAGALHCHRNTVVYRLARLRELLGNDLDSPAQTLLWSLALRL